MLAAPSGAVWSIMDRTLVINWNCHLFTLGKPRDPRLLPRKSPPWPGGFLLPGLSFRPVAIVGRNKAKPNPRDGLVGGIAQTKVVRAVGIEPTLLSEPDFESGASTSFTTPACMACPRQMAKSGASVQTKISRTQDKLVRRLQGASCADSLLA